MPISGGVMCHSGTRIGRTKAIESALKASKKVALPITIRATTNQLDVGTCSIRAIRSAEVRSVSKAGEDETSEASDRDVALTTDKASSALLFFGPRSARPIIQRLIRYRESAPKAPEFFRQSPPGTRSASNDGHSTTPKASRPAPLFVFAPTSRPARRNLPRRRSR